MRIENGIQATSYAAGVTHVIDRDYDRLRVRVWERAAQAVQRQRMQEIVLMVMAIVLGCVTGWAVVR